MYQLKLGLRLGIVLIVSQAACGRSSYKSYIYEKPSANQAVSGDAKPLLPEKNLDSETSTQPDQTAKEELPAIDQKTKVCPPLSAVPSIMSLALDPNCPTPPPPETPVPDAPKPPVGDKPSQN